MVAVQDAERRRAGVHAVGRRGARGSARARRRALALNTSSLEHPLAQLAVVDALGVGEVVDAVEGNRGGDRGVGVLEPGLEAGSPAVSAASAHRCPPAEPPVMQMKSGSAPYSAACSRTQAIARLTSTRWSGKVAARAQPVVDVEADPAVGGEVVEQRDALLGAGADDPAAAVDLDDRRPQARAAGRRSRGCVDVEAQRPRRRSARTRPRAGGGRRAATASAAARAGG